MSRTGSSTTHSWCLLLLGLGALARALLRLALHSVVNAEESSTWKYRQQKAITGKKYVVNWALGKLKMLDIRTAPVDCNTMMKLLDMTGIRLTSKKTCNNIGGNCDEYGDGCLLIFCCC